MEKGRRSALDCSRLAAAGTLRSTCPAWLARAVTRSVATLGPRASGRGGQGSPRGDVEELEDGAGPLGGADGGHRGRRACETAAGPAGRCHVIVSSAAHAAAASASGLSEGFPAPLEKHVSFAAQPGTLRLSRLRPGRRPQSSECCSPGGRVRPLGPGQLLLAGAWEPSLPCRSCLARVNACR